MFRMQCFTQAKHLKAFVHEPSSVKMQSQKGSQAMLWSSIGLTMVIAITGQGTTVVHVTDHLRKYPVQ